MNTAVGDFPGLALMDLMKPYMPPTPENYQQVLRDIHGRVIQMWAGCIWVPIYEVMTRKHLKLVTLEENLEMAADIGMDATTSLDEAFAEAMERHGPDAKVVVLPFARYQLPRNMVRMDAEPLRYPQSARTRSPRAADPVQGVAQRDPATASGFVRDADRRRRSPLRGLEPCGERQGRGHVQHQPARRQTSPTSIRRSAAPTRSSMPRARI